MDAPGPGADGHITLSGSAASLVLTVIGLYLRRVGGVMIAGDLVALARDAGIDDGAARTAITRWKKRGVLQSVKVGTAPAYALTQAGQALLERGDRHIFATRPMAKDDRWIVISVSVPETERKRRTQLRARLAQIGTGILAPALWIAPQALRDEVEATMTDLAVYPEALLITADLPTVGGASPRQAVARWWNLPSIEQAHITFEHRRAALRADLTPFHRYVSLVDAWRPVPYADPGLPLELLPASWPGRHTHRDFEAEATALEADAWAHVQARIGDRPARGGRTASAPQG